MKKILISAAMIIILVFNIISVSAVTENDVYPESQHNYGNYFSGEWFYTYKEEAEQYKRLVGHYPTSVTIKNTFI